MLTKLPEEIREKLEPVFNELNYTFPFECGIIYEIVLSLVKKNEKQERDLKTAALVIGSIGVKK